MKVERPEDLIYQTYHMIDWKKEAQTPSVQRCVNCENQMSAVEALVGKDGQRYLGLVSPGEPDRSIWIKAD